MGPLEILKRKIQEQREQRAQQSAMDVPDLIKRNESGRIDIPATYDDLRKRKEEERLKREQELEEWQAKSEMEKISSGMGIDPLDDKANRQQAESTSLENMGLSQTMFVNLDTPYINMDAIGAQYVVDNLQTKFAKTFGSAVGGFIGDYGDLFQIAKAGISSWFGAGEFGDLMERNNSFSRYLQGIRDKLEIDNQFYINPIIDEPEKWEWSNFVNPEFWTIQTARVIPMLVDLLPAFGVGSLAKWAGKKAMLTGAKPFIRKEGRVAMKQLMKAKNYEDFLKNSAILSKKGFRASTQAVGGVREGIKLQKANQAGILKHFLTDRLEVTPIFEKILKAAGSGFYMNQRFGASNAARLFNQYNEINNEYKEKYGVEMFAPGELSEMSSSTYMMSTAYMPIDMLSFGIVYGGEIANIYRAGNRLAGRMLQGMNLGKMGKMFTTGAQREVSANLFSKASRPIFKAMARATAYTLPEGFENAVMATWTEWSNMKSYEEAHGSLVGFQGRVSKNYGKTFESGGFWDYLWSDDSAPIRQAGVAMGALMSGMFNFMPIINGHADNAQRIHSSSERLKKRLEKGTQEYFDNLYHFKSEVASFHYEGKDFLIPQFLNRAFKKGEIDEETFTLLKDTHDEILSKYQRLTDNVSDLTSVQRFHLFKNHEAHETISKFLSDEKAKSEERIMDYMNVENRTERQRLIDNEKASYEARTYIAEKMREKVENNIKNVLEGKPYDEVVFIRKKTADGEDILAQDETASPTTENSNINPRAEEEKISKMVDDGDGNKIEVAESPKSNDEGLIEARKQANQIESKAKEAKKRAQTPEGKKEKVEQEASAEKEKIESEHAQEAKRIDEDATLSDEAKIRAHEKNNKERDQKIQDIEKAKNEKYAEIDQKATEEAKRISEEQEKAKNQDEEEVAPKRDIKKEFNDLKRGNLFINPDGTVNRRSSSGKAFKDVDEAITHTEKLLKNQEESGNKKRAEIYKEDLKALRKYKEESIKQEAIKSEGAKTEETAKSEGIKDENKTEVKSEDGAKTEAEKTEDGYVKDDLSGLSNKEIFDQLFNEFKHGNRNYQYIKDRVAELTKRNVKKGLEIFQDFLDTVKPSKENSNESRLTPENEAQKAAESSHSSQSKGSPAVRPSTTAANKSNKKAIGKVSSLASKITPTFMKRKISYSKYTDGSVNRPNWDMNVTASMVVANQMARKQFKNVHERPSYFVVDDLMSIYGTPSTALSFLGVNYINGESWYQGYDFQHENAHIYYKLTKHLEHTKEFMNYALRNEALKKRIMQTYWDKEYFYIYNMQTEKFDIMLNKGDFLKYIIGDEFEMGVLESWNLAGFVLDAEGNVTKQINITDPRVDGDGSNMTITEGGKTHKVVTIADYAESRISKLVQDGAAERITKFEDQPVWMEEVFTNTLEGPMSKEFNNYFERTENVRQLKAKRWWQKLRKGAGEKTEEMALAERELLKVLSEEELAKYDDAKIAILKSMSKQMEFHKGDDRFFQFSGSVMESRIGNLGWAPDFAQRTMRELEKDPSNNPILKDVKKRILDAQESAKDPNITLLTNEVKGLKLSEEIARRQTEIKRNELLEQKKEINRELDQANHEFQDKYGDKSIEQVIDDFANYDLEVQNQNEKLKTLADRKRTLEEELQILNKKEEERISEFERQVTMSQIYSEERLSSLLSGLNKLIDQYSNKKNEQIFNETKKRVDSGENIYENWNVGRYRPDVLQRNLRNLAQTADSPEMFIAALDSVLKTHRGDSEEVIPSQERSKISEDVADFYELVRETYKTSDGKNLSDAFLAEIWHLLKNTHKVPGTEIRVNSEGKVEIVSAKSGIDKSRIGMTQARLERLLLVYKRRMDGENVSESSRYEVDEGAKIAEWMYKIVHEGDDMSALEFLKYFLDPGVNPKEFIRPGIVIDRGQAKMMMPYLIGFLKNKIGKKPVEGGQEGEFTYDVSNLNMFKKNEKGFVELTPEWVQFTENMIATQKPYLRDLTFNDARGNQVPQDIVGNMFTREMDRIFLDFFEAVNYPKPDGTPKTKKEVQAAKKELFEKYAMNTGQNNHLLRLWAVEGGRIDDNSIDLNTGIRNEATGRAEDYKNQSQLSQSINRLIFFLETQSRVDQDSGARYKTYRSFTQPFGDSSRNYHYTALHRSFTPEHIKSDEGNIDAYSKEIIDHFIQNTKNADGSGKYYDTLLKRHLFTERENTGMTTKEKEKSFRNGLERAIRTEIQFYNDNANVIKNLSTFKKLVEFNEKEGKWQLNSEGRKQIANFELNEIVNGMEFNEIFLPTYNPSQITKRSKQMASTFQSLSEKVKIQNIPFHITDAKTGEKSDIAYDGQSFVLSHEDPRYNDDGRLNNLMMLTGDVSGLKKMIGSGVERGQFGFQGNRYDKNFYVPLTEELVLHTPELKPLRDWMIELRRRQIENLEANGKEFELDLRSPSEMTTLMFASSSGGLKKMPFTESYAKKFASENGYSKDGIDLNMIPKRDANGKAIEPSKIFSEFEKEIDLMYGYDEKGGLYKGFKGEDFGIQMEIDKETRRATVASQMVKMLNSSFNQLSGEGKMNVTKALEHITKAMDHQREAILNNFNLQDYAKLRKYIEDSIDMDSVDPSIAKMFKEGVPLFEEPIRTWVNNTIKNRMMESGNRLRVNGMNGHSVSAGWKKGVVVEETSIEAGSSGEKMVKASKKLLEYSTDSEFGSDLADYRVDAAGIKPTRPGEVVISNERTDIQARRVFMFDDAGKLATNDGYAYDKLQKMYYGLKDHDARIERLESYVKKLSKEEGRQYKPVFNKEHTKQIGWYIEGDMTIATRIPSHGVQSTLVAEVVGHAPIGKSGVIGSNKFHERMGGDFDGDALYLNFKNKIRKSKKPSLINESSKEWNSAFDAISKHLLSAEMGKINMESIKYEEQVQKAVNKSKKLYGKDEVKAPLLESSEGRRKMISDSLEAQGLIASYANLHTVYNTLRAHGVELDQPIRIVKNGKEEIRIASFEDKPLIGRNYETSIGIESGKLLNVILDNANLPFAQELFMNNITVPYFAALSNMGLKIEDIAVIMNHPIMKDIYDVKMNRTIHGEIQPLSSTQRREILNRYNKRIKNIADKITDNEARIYKNSGEDLTVNFINGIPEAKDVFNLITKLDRINGQLGRITKLTSQHTRMSADGNTLRRQVMELEDIFISQNTELRFKQGDTNYIKLYREALESIPPKPLPEVKQTKGNITTDPVLLNYVATAVNTYTRISPMLDPTTRPGLKETFVSIIDRLSSGENGIMDWMGKKVNRDLMTAFRAKGRGFNRPILYKVNDDGSVVKTGKAKNRAEAVEYLQKQTGHNLAKNLSEYFNELFYKKLSEIRKKDPAMYESFLRGEGGAGMDPKNDIFLFARILKINEGALTDRGVMTFIKKDFDQLPEVAKDHAIQDFQNLPEHIKYGMVLHNMVYNSKNPNSDFSVLFGKYEKQFSDKISELMSRKKDEKLFNDTELDNLQRQLLIENSNGMRSIENVDVHKTPIGSPELFNRMIREIPGLELNMDKGEKFAIRVETRINGKGTEGDAYVFTYPDSAYAKLSEEYRTFRGDFRQRRNIAKNFFEKEFSNPENWILIKNEDGINSNNDIQLMTALTDETVKPTGGETTPVKKGGGPDSNATETKAELTKLNEAIKKKSESGKFDDFVEKRRTHDYWEYRRKLGRAEYDSVREYKPGVSEADKKANYQKYLQHKKDAAIINKRYPKEKIRNMTDEEIFDVMFNNQVGIMKQDRFAYASVIQKFNTELFHRLSKEQISLAKEKSGVDIKYGGKDITAVKAWLGSNNIRDDHPAVQALIRRFEVEQKSFQKQLNLHHKKLSDATDELYREQFGSVAQSKTKVGAVLDSIKKLFENKEAVYEKLYGPLIVRGVDKDGIGFMRYKTDAEIREDYANGKISNAQLKFYNTTKDIVAELKKYNPYNAGQDGSYIPYTAPGLLETYARRGMLGVFAGLKNVESQITDVVLTFVNPITGKKEKGTFGYAQNLYKLYSEKHKGSRYSLEFLKLKKRAISLNRKNINEDGSSIERSDVSVASALQDSNVEKFTAGNDRSLSDFHSLDLNKTFSEHIYGTLFTNGDGVFGGFKKFLPQVDGVLQFYKSQGHKNMYNYVDRVWKQNFLGSKKQRIDKNSKTLEVLGIRTDDVIDFITNSSLMYWLGYRGLAKGMGLYVTGNALVGKYKNVVNQGGKAWILGEKRFWGIDEGFNAKNFGPKKANEILNKIGFMEVNIYDHVSMEKKNSLGKAIMDLALFPMSYSERWIQGVQFLGMLTEAEWNTLKKGGDISNQRKAELEDHVKQSQGRGYQAIDQRMIQMYSWGKNMMQFNRFIPTVADELFSPRHITRHGTEYVGTYTAMMEPIQKAVRGDWTPKQFTEYYKNLKKPERERMNRALIGFGLLSFGIATGMGGKWTSDLMSDNNVILDFERINRKFPSASYNMIDAMLK